MKKVQVAVAVTILFLAVSCKMSFRKDDDRVKALNDMQQTDADFARLARDKGFRTAFLEYIEPDGMLLRDNYMPIIGADAISYISGINDSTFTLDWEPMGGDVGASGDLGFTYGLYELANDTAIQRGTYLTIWRKQESGKWKFLVDASTQGLGRVNNE